MLLWLLAFCDTLGTPHQTLYFFLPCACLVIPALATVIAWRLPRGEVQVGCFTFYAFALVLFVNFAAFLSIVMLSGGGM